MKKEYPGTTGRGSGRQRINVSAIMFTLSAIFVVCISTGTFRAGMTSSALKRDNSQLFRLEIDSMKLIQQFAARKKSMSEVVTGLDILLGETELVCLKAMRMKYPSLALSGRSDFNRKKFIHEESCRTLSNFITGMQTVVQFSIFHFSEESEYHKLIINDAAHELVRLQTGFDGNDFSSYLFEPPGEAPDDARYVFLFVLSSARADHFGAYGYERETTPVMDALGGSGIVVKDAFAQSPLTIYSVASILSGDYPISEGVSSRWDGEGSVSLIKEIKQAGFLTAGFSATSKFYSDFGYDADFDFFSELPYARASIILNRLSSWLEQSRGEQDKIFVMVHLSEPHDPFIAPGKYMDIFDPGAGIKHTIHGLRSRIEKDISKAAAIDPACDYDPVNENFDNTELLLKCLSVAGAEVTERDVFNLVARYDGELRYVDSRIGSFVEYLKLKGLYDNSTIVITSDHGDPLFEHNQVRHSRSLYDEVLHVPLLIMPARELNPSWEHASAELIDVLPTIMAMNNIERPLGIDGLSIFEKDASDDLAYSYGADGLNYRDGVKYHSFSIRNSEYKYIQNTDSVSGALISDEFYNLEKDPGEYDDVREENSDKFSDLRRKLEYWRDTSHSNFITRR